MNPDLLATKLYIPTLRSDHVVRSQLVQSLEASRRQGNRLTLISAPAGYGKTTLVVEWIQESRLRAAWLSLDEGDNDPVRFLSYLIGALQTVHADLGEPSLILLRSPRPPKTESVLSALVNEIAQFQEPFLLVLDDYHLIHTEEAHAATIFLLEHMPPSVHLVILTRADPPLPVARLRGRGHVAELRLTDLRFTPGEASRFLELASGLSLTPLEAAAITSRTEGWAAGLQMVALALRAQSGGQDNQYITAFLHSFSGSHRYIMDYLVEEVLESQPDEIQGFLLQTSTLERLCGPLCDALLVDRSPTPSQSILENLEHANLFLIPLDDQRAWYRYHQLFADLLKQRLLNSKPGLEPELHRRASAWFEQNGWLNEAIEHALAAGDTARAARLIDRAAETILMRSEVATFLRWVGQLPETDIRSIPRLGIYQAWGLLLNGQAVQEIDQRLAALEEGDPDIACMAAPVHSYIALIQGRSDRAAELSRTTLERLPEGEQFLRSLAALSLASAYLAEYHTEEGLRTLEQAAQISRQSGNIMVAVLVLINLAELYRKQGELYKARQHYQEALDLATDTHGNYLPIATRPLTGLGDLARERNDLETASRLLDQAVYLSGIWMSASVFASLLPLARVKFALGDLDGAQQALDQARKAAEGSRSTLLDDIAVDMYQAWLWIKQGRLDLAEEWAKKRQIEAGPDEATDASRASAYIDHLWKYECLVLARLRLAQNQPEKALRLIDLALPVLTEIQRVGAIIEAEEIRALALQQLGKPEEALDSLKRALGWGKPEGFIRTFIDEGEALKNLLQLNKLKVESSLRPYVEQLLEAFSPKAQGTQSTTPSSELPEKLSTREIEVLRLLQSPLSAEEIANELVISVSTARSHIKSIYAKLGVHSRIEAIERARELRLLP